MQTGRLSAVVGVVGTLLRGGVIGVANIIPGVSGGTLALMLGIYERLIDALGHINLALLRRGMAVLLLRKGAWQAFWQYVREADLFFVGWLGTGAILAIVAASRVMGWILLEHPAFAFAFFMGLVLASVVYPWRSLTRRSWVEAVTFLLAAVLTVGLSLAVPESTRLERAERKQALAAEQVDAAVVVQLDIRHLVLIYGAAAVAISAMVLPGVSGAFVLLLFGVYFDVLTAVKGGDLLVLGVFAVGALTGLLVCTRLVSRLLHRYFNPTMAFMLGLMAGSLYELWPFKKMIPVAGEPLFLGNTLRGSSLVEEGGALLAFCVGLLLVAFFAWATRTDQDPVGKSQSGMAVGDQWL